MTTAEQETQTELLNILQEQLEEFISNYALDQIEDLNDEEYDQVVRTMYFSRGNKEHWVVMTPYGQMRSKIPSELAVSFDISAILDAKPLKECRCNG